MIQMEVSLFLSLLSLCEVCVCVRERERHTERDKERERQRERGELEGCIRVGRGACKLQCREDLDPL